MKRAQSGWLTLAQVSQQREESMDMIVPDVSPDVFTIISATAVCTLQEKALRQDRVELMGSAEVTVLYMAEEERVCMLHGSIPVKHACEAKGCTDRCMAQVRMEAATATAVVLNPRKLSLRVTISEEVIVWQDNNFELTEEIVSAADEGIEYRKAGETYTLLAAVAEKPLNFAEDLHLHGDAAKGTMLAYTAVEWHSEEIKVMTNKLMIRGVAELKAVTVTETGMYAGSCNYSLPFSQMMECDRSEPGDAVELSFTTTALDCRLTMSEGSPQLTCAMSGTMMAKIYRERRLEAVVDLFSTCCTSEREITAIAVECKPDKTEYRAAARETVECPFQPEQICDWSWCARGECLPDGGALCYFWFRILCRTSDGDLRTVCRRIDQQMEGEACCCCSPRAEGVRVTPEDKSLCVEFTAVAEYTVRKPCAMTQVTACRVDKTHPRERPAPGTLLLRAAGTEETVWSISKQYGVPPTMLREANKLASDAAVTPGQLIIVPFAR
ncbi:MAG: DUF3794 domain-containing protein [Clostridiaceae bacterium]|nr:DUF3794 domain-containing protein [Clostridiaceae bacterium]